MNLISVAEQPLIFTSGEKLSKVVSGMHTNKSYEAFIVDGKEFKGVVSAGDIIKKNVGDPEKTKISGMAIIRKIKPLSNHADLKDVLDSFVVNNYRSIPISGDGKLLNLTKLGFLKLTPKNILQGKTAEEVMFFPECVSVDDNIGVVKSILKEAHVYRIAVLNGDKVEGIVDELSLLKTMTSKMRKPGWERGGGEKIKESEVGVSNRLFMEEDPLRASPGTELKYIFNMMVEKNKNTVVIEEGGKLLGLVTPREIIKLLGSDISGVYVNVSGIQNEDTFIQNVVDSEIRSRIRKIGKLVHIHYMTIHVKKFKTTGKKMTFVVRGKLVTNKGLFVADHDSWDLTKSAREMLKRMQREIEKRVEKERDIGREWAHEERGK